MEINGKGIQMGWLDKILRGGGDLPPFEPLPPNAKDEQLREHVNTLTPDEAAVYKWLREGYSIKWTSETVFKTNAEGKALARRVYHKLGVSNQRGLVRAYGVLDKFRRETVKPPDIFNE